MIRIIDDGQLHGFVEQRRVLCEDVATATLQLCEYSVNKLREMCIGLWPTEKFGKLGRNDLTMRLLKHKFRNQMDPYKD